jgi:hypothetical protein
MNVKDFEAYTRHEVNDPACIVTIKDGVQVLTTPEGEVLPKQVWSRVYTGVDGISYAITKLYVKVRNINEVPS